MQALAAVGAALQGMLLDARGRLQAPRVIVLRFALAAGLAFALPGVGPDEGGGLGGPVFQLCDAGQGRIQLGLEGRVLRAQRRHRLPQRLILRLQRCYLVGCHHVISCSRIAALTCQRGLAGWILLARPRPGGHVPQC